MQLEAPSIRFARLPDQILTFEFLGKRMIRNGIDSGIQDDVMLHMYVWQKYMDVFVLPWNVSFNFVF